MKPNKEMRRSITKWKADKSGKVAKCIACNGTGVAS